MSMTIMSLGWSCSFLDFKGGHTDEELRRYDRDPTSARPGLAEGNEVQKETMLLFHCCSDYDQDKK